MLHQLAEDEGKKKVKPLRVKKLYILGALLIERYHEHMKITSRTKGKHRRPDVSTHTHTHTHTHQAPAPRHKLTHTHTRQAPAPRHKHTFWMSKAGLTLYDFEFAMSCDCPHDADVITTLCERPVVTF